VRHPVRNYRKGAASVGPIGCTPWGGGVASQYNGLGLSAIPQTRSARRWGPNQWGAPQRGGQPAGGYGYEAQPPMYGQGPLKYEGYPKTLSRVASLKNTKPR